MAFYHAIPADLTGDGIEDIVLYDPTSTSVYIYSIDALKNTTNKDNPFVAGPRQYNPRLMDSRLLLLQLAIFFTFIGWLLFAEVIKIPPHDLDAIPILLGVPIINEMPVATVHTLDPQGMLDRTPILLGSSSHLNQVSEDPIGIATIDTV